MKRGGGFATHEMGTGKTVIGVVWANTLADEIYKTGQEESKVLIIAPAIMVPTWVEEFQTWSALAWNIEEITKDTPRDRWGRKLPHPDTNCFIISYTQLVQNKGRWTQALLKHYDFNIMIADEWHYAKSFKAMRTKRALLCTRSADYFLALTGTPTPNSTKDLYSQLLPFAHIDDIGRNCSTFCERFMYLKHNGFGYTYTGLRNEETLKQIMKPFTRRRLKRKVQKQLPKVLLKKIYVDIPESLAKESLKYVDQAVEMVTGQREYVDPEKKDFIATMQRQLGLSKCRATIEYLNEAIEDKPLVVFCFHTDVIRTLDKIVSKKHSTGIIDGKTSGRTDTIKRFQDGKIDVLFVNGKAGGHGITLTRSSRAVFPEQYWSWAVMSQCIARLDRISQTSTVHIDFIVARRSIDPKIVAAYTKKRALNRKLFGE